MGQCVGSGQGVRRLSVFMGNLVMVSALVLSIAACTSDSSDPGSPWADLAVEWVKQPGEEIASGLVVPTGAVATGSVVTGTSGFCAEGRSECEVRPGSS